MTHDLLNDPDFRIEVSRKSYELEQTYGFNAYRRAERLSETARAEGDDEAAYFWSIVAMDLTPR